MILKEVDEIIRLSERNDVPTIEVHCSELIMLALDKEFKSLMGWPENKSLNISQVAIHQKGLLKIIHSLPNGYNLKLT